MAVACYCHIKNKNLLKGIHLADSVTIDPHKWFYAPLDVGAILVKDHSRLTTSFGIQHAYLTDQSGQKNSRYQFYVNGFEQSKRFRSLKVWMSFQHYGKDTIGEWVDNNVKQARYLHELAETSDDFESATAPKMSAICIRYKAGGLTNENATTLHHEVAARIEKEGNFWFATTMLKGKTWFRINPVNIYTTIETMDALFNTLGEYCRDNADKMEVKTLGQLLEGLKLSKSYSPNAHPIGPKYRMTPAKTSSVRDLRGLFYERLCFIYFISVQG